MIIEYSQFQISNVLSSDRLAVLPTSGWCANPVKRPNSPIACFRANDIRFQTKQHIITSVSYCEL